MAKKKDQPIRINAKNGVLSNLQNDNIYVKSELKSLSELTGMPVAKGLSKALISEGEIVNIVSNNYGYIPNEKFFYEVESKLIEADIKYATRSINRGNASFAVDYILSDENYHVDVKTGGDKIMPMMRFTNTYDGGPCSGTFGFFREVCMNGLHIAQTKTGFKCRHIGQALTVVLPNIDEMVKKFIDNEYYTLKRKFEVLAECPIKDLTDFVKYTCGKSGLFNFETSKKNPDKPSANAQLVMDTIEREAKILGVQPNLWLGYNAFNEILHTSKKPFQRQRKLDAEVFDVVLEQAN